MVTSASPSWHIAMPSGGALTESNADVTHQFLHA